ncbi:MAG TPA: MFS transporter [Ktedonobacterales bacterium]|nr:MFS transporter [Ktedonobacterales bacterium]
MSDVVLPQTTTGTPNHGTAERAARYAAYVFWLMFAVNFLNYLDRYVFSGLVFIIQPDLKLSDFQVGLLGSAFLLIYTVLALPLGFLAERVARKTIVAVGVAIWSFATAFTGLTTSFIPLLVTRAVLGVGEASYYPAGTPLLAAHYPPARRAHILARWSVGALIGAAVGFLIATFFAAPGTWRFAFFFTGIPGLLFAFLMWRTREKVRHDEDPPAERLTGAGAAFWPRLRSYLRIPTVRVIIALHALGFFALTGVSYFLSIYLNRTYGKGAPGFGDAGLSPKLVPVLGGAVVLIGGILGLFVGSAWATRLSKRHPGARVLTGGLGFLIAAPCVLIAIGASFVLPHLPFYSGASVGTRLALGVGIFAVFALLASFFLNIYNGPVSAALLDVVPPAERAACGGTELTLAHLLGDVYATTVIGALAGLLTSSFGSQQTGLGVALLLTCPLALVASGVVGIWGSKFYARDVAALGSTADAMLGTTAAATAG